jgi:hypothetical protein
MERFEKLLVKALREQFQVSYTREGSKYAFLCSQEENPLQITVSTIFRKRDDDNNRGVFWCYLAESGVNLEQLQSRCNDDFTPSIPYSIVNFKQNVEGALTRAVFYPQLQNSIIVANVSSLTQDFYSLVSKYVKSQSLKMVGARGGM